MAVLLVFVLLFISNDQRGEKDSEPERKVQFG